MRILSNLLLLLAAIGLGLIASIDLYELMAADDPIIGLSQFDSLPASVVVDVTEHGGHGAYLTDWQLNSWVDQYAVDHFSRQLSR